MTTPKLTGELHLEGDGTCYTGTWALTGETLEWGLRGKKYRIKSDGDLSRAVAYFVEALGKQVLNESVKLRGCMTCNNFVMSAMARDMGRGQRGVCKLHQIGVEVCFLCSDYVPTTRVKKK